jgi:hypothetical protein
MKNRLEAYNTREALITFRKHTLERQRISNYANEYEILKTALAASRTPFLTRELMEGRTKELENLLGASLQQNLVRLDKII